MSRFHVHVRVPDITQSIGFYSTLFGVAPSVVKPDYAKWMLDDPRVNFAIYLGSADAKGIDHLGIQVEADDGLRKLAARLKTAGEKTRDEEAVTCCYAKGNKSWVNDPSGVRWETFYTFGEATVYGEDAAEVASAESTACCA